MICDDSETGLRPISIPQGVTTATGGPPIYNFLTISMNYWRYVQFRHYRNAGTHLSVRCGIGRVRGCCGHKFR